MADQFTRELLFDLVREISQHIVSVTMDGRVDRGNRYCVLLRNPLERDPDLGFRV